VIVGLPALRMTDNYLAIATLAFAVIIQEVFTRLESVTGGFAGLAVDKPMIFGVRFNDEASFCYLRESLLALTILLTKNLLRSPTRRVWVAIRDSEIAAQSMGVHLPLYKSVAFAYSAALMVLAGALFAHKIAFHSVLDPDVAVGDRGRASGNCLRCDFRGPTTADHCHPARLDPCQYGPHRERDRHRPDRHSGSRHRRVPECLSGEKLNPMNHL
jgi:hypothetical protein